MTDSTKYLFIRPLDVWLFRNGKPFNAGSDHRAESVFPPLPTVLQGAMRTHYIEQHGGIPAYLSGKLEAVNAKVGAKGQPPPKSFQLRGGFLAKLDANQTVTCYVPKPAHVYLNGEIYETLTPQPLRGVRTDLADMDHLLWRDESVTPSKDSGGGWLRVTDLETLLRDGSLPKGDDNNPVIKPSNHFFEREARLGIQLDYRSRTTETGQLYQTEFIRLKAGYGLYVELQGLTDWPDTGTLRLGGESRVGVYDCVQKAQLPQISGGENGFTLTFLSPTYFTDGWKPQNWAKFVGDSATFIGAAVPKPLVLGGFDLANKRHKPSRRYVQAGSTYYFKGTMKASPPSTICDDFTEETVNYGQYGFGQYLLGAW